jgi:hypothetical protein
LSETLKSLPAKRKTNIQRFTELDTARSARMARARSCAALAGPMLLPPAGSNGDMEITLPFASEATRGVTRLSGKILNVMMPLDNQPVFTFIASNGRIETPPVRELMETLATEIYRTMTQGNLRDVAFRAIQHLAVIGDVLVVVEGVSKFRLIRLDQYVVRRDVYGDEIEIVYITFIEDPDQKDVVLASTMPTATPYHKPGFKTIIVRILKQADGSWVETREYADGTPVDAGGTYKVSRYIPLRWIAIDGEDYGRSLIEEIHGDVSMLEAATESLTNALAASSVFWMRRRPGSALDSGDATQRPIGSWLTANEEDIGVVAPGRELSPQVGAMAAAVQQYRSKIAEAFLDGRASMPTGDRVTAAAIHMVAQELSDGIGGPVITTVNQFFGKTIDRVLHEMISGDMLDPAFAKMLTDKTITYSVVTGLQAMNRSQQLSRLLQTLEYTYRLPQRAQERVKWEQFLRTLYSSMGYRSSDWVQTDEELQNDMMNQARAGNAMEAERQIASAAIAGTANAAAAQVMPNAGA